jgi:hypothetical protein
MGVHFYMELPYPFYASLPVFSGEVALVYAGQIARWLTCARAAENLEGFMLP